MAADIALRAKLIRTDIGMDSASAMSKLLGMSPNAWKAIEDGRNLPSSETLLKLVDRGYDATWLLAGRGSMRLGVAGPGVRLKESP